MPPTLVRLRSLLLTVRLRTRPARRWLAGWLLAPLTTRRWVVVVLVVLCLIGLLGCATPTPREQVRAEAARLRAQYGDHANWPAAEWARWEAMAREVHR
jgi:hypothetical protein